MESRIALQQLSISKRRLSRGYNTIDISMGLSPKLGSLSHISWTALLKSTPRLEMYRRLPAWSQYALTLGGYGNVRVITYIQLSVAGLVSKNYIGDL